MTESQEKVDATELKEESQRNLVPAEEPTSEQIKPAEEPEEPKLVTNLSFKRQESVMVFHAMEALKPKMNWLTFYAVAVGFGV